jgi:PAS domain S-box-containing protein/putative nucleotidyltransferase with HDIG domain
MMGKILIVDDEKSIRNTLSEFAKEDGHETFTAEDAERGLQMVAKQRPQVVVTDIILPRITGVSLLKQVHSIAPDVQVIVITGEPTAETAAEAVRSGAFDYLPKPISRHDFNSTVASAMRVAALAERKRQLEQENLRYQEHLEDEVEEKTLALRESEEKYRTVVENANEAVFVAQENRLQFVNPKTCKITGYTAEQLTTMPFAELLHSEDRDTVIGRFRQRIAGGDVPAAYEFRIVTASGETRWIEIRPVVVEWAGRPATLNLATDITDRVAADEALRRALDGTIEAIGQTTETRDPYTAGHQRRVTELAVAIAGEMGLDPDKIDGLHAAGLMHDIGKMAVPAEILSKPSALTEMEMALIRSHPQAAYDILKSVAFPWPVARIVLQHHELVDGSGYPNGLRRDDILVEARILAVADVVEAMASHRPYRAALGIDAALEEIASHRGTRYDANVVASCLRLFREGRFRFSGDPTR